jgi:spermidine/putrescine transport system permease protein
VTLPIRAAEWYIKPASEEKQDQDIAEFVTKCLFEIISFDDFILTYFCAGSSVQTLSLYILSMIRSGISPVVNALSALLLFISSLMALVYFQLSSRSKIF